MSDTEVNPAKTNFIRQIIDRDLSEGKNQGKVTTRFPPEPNGYLHIGHAKSICLNFGVARDYKGTCNLRFDDTNPEKEDEEFVRSISEDVKWLGFDWGENLFHASDYFDALYECAKNLIRNQKAYVCSLDAEKMREYRGTLTEPGKPSPDRDRPSDESLDLLERMKAGEFEEGKYTLRAKIDMASPNINLRDPAIYRIKRVEHQRTGSQWNIYPMYDFAHGLSDAFEGVTHSLCTLEFEDHRPLYDWYLEVLATENRPQQIEFARMNLTYTVLSKRKLLQLVDEGHVDGWDDPRMPTLSGLRRRGYTPRAIRNFCDQIGVTKKNSIIDVLTLENALREDLNEVSQRRLAVLRPLKVTITNWEEGKQEDCKAVNHPKDEGLGTRIVPFGKTIYIECDDFMEDAPKKFFRLAPGRSVRLKYAYIIQCDEVVKDSTGEVTELKCSYFENSKSGQDISGIKVKSTIHWVSEEGSYEATVRLYDRLISKPEPSGDSFLDDLNPNSLETVSRARLELSLRQSPLSEVYQFERMGYFCVDSRETQDGTPVFNRTVTLRDAWAKLEKKVP